MAYVFDLKVQGNKLYNGTQDLSLGLVGWDNFMWTKWETVAPPSYSLAATDSPVRGMSAIEWSDALRSYNASYTRAFCINTWAPKTSRIFPWKKAGELYDLEQYDVEYLAKLKVFADTLASRGIILCLALFEGSALRTYPDFPKTDVWEGHPWHPNNCIQEPISSTDNAINEFYSVTGEGRDLQQAYVEYMVSSLRGYNNIIFQICGGCSSTSFQSRVAGWIKATNSAVLVNASSTSSSIWEDRNVDIIELHTGDWTERRFESLNLNPHSVQGYNKPIIYDSDGSASDYAHFADRMVEVAQAVVNSGQTVSFKFLYEPVAEETKAFAIPVAESEDGGDVPGPEPPPTDYRLDEDPVWISVRDRILGLQTGDSDITSQLNPNTIDKGRVAQSVSSFLGLMVSLQYITEDDARAIINDTLTRSPEGTEPSDTEE